MALFWIGGSALLIWGLSPAFPVRTPPSAPDAWDILRRRYARGEISDTEFIQARAALG